MQLHLRDSYNICLVRKNDNNVGIRCLMEHQSRDMPCMVDNIDTYMT
jgi:hypothetical protein